MTGLELTNSKSMILFSCVINRDVGDERTLYNFMIDMTSLLPNYEAFTSASLYTLDIKIKESKRKELFLFAQASPEYPP